MVREKLKNISFLLLLLSSAVMIFFTIKKTTNKPAKINQCSATLNENNTRLKINARFQRVISIVNNKGYAFDTGVLNEGDSNWRLNRFYTFSLKPVSGDKYELSIVSHQKAYDDNVPDTTLKRFRPDQVRKNHITSIEEVEPGVWLFSGLAFPLFACKELKPD